jgi:ribosomal protein S18 acetylase RimI-like enzyme
MATDPTTQSPLAVLDWRPLDRFGWDEIADAFRLCYEDYLIPIRMTAPQMAARFATEDLDMQASGSAFVDGKVAAIGMIARRGRLSRLAAFGVSTGFRGKGVASLVLDRLVRESETRGDARMELEVFEHNHVAVKLYERFGFARIDRLVGLEKPAANVPRTAALELSSPDILVRMMREEPIEDLPWQLQPATLARFAAPWQVISEGEALALVDLSRDAAIEVRMIYVPPASRRQGHARALVSVLEGLAGDRPIRAPQLIPARHQAFAEALGFAPLEHCQFRMAR